MVSMVTGSGTGLASSSKDVLGSQGELGSAATGRAAELVTVNAATGNLVVQERDEYLVGIGPDIELLRTYNSQGAWDGDNNDNWRIGYYRKVTVVGGVVQRIDADGAERTYALSGGVYVNKEGGGQYDTLSLAGGVWTWTDGDTGVKETYRAAGADAQGNSVFRLAQIASPDGHFIGLTYNASNLIDTIGTYKAGQVLGTDPADEKVSLSYSGTRLGSITTTYQDGGLTKTRSVTSYTYYPADSGNKVGKLKTATTHLTQADGAGDKGYAVTYDYDANGRLSSLQQTDGTALTIAYHADGRVKSTKDNQNRVTSYSYDTANGVTTVTDAVGQITTLKYDAKAQLLEVAGAVLGGASFKQSYTYDAATGDLLTVSNAKNETTTYQYNSTGAMTRRTDHAGNVLERSYTVDGLLASETVYLSPDPDGAGSGTATLPRTTSYFYDSNGSSAVKRRLAYVLGPQGEVTRYSYNPLGQVERRVEYTGALFTAGSPSFTSLEAWVNGSQALSVERQVIDYTYNLRGQVETEKRYATVSGSGNTIALSGLSTTTYAYDPSGRLLSRQDASGVKLSYEYDGLGRVTKALDGNNAATIYTYDDANRKTSVELANGQTTVQVFDTLGQLVSSEVMGANAAGSLGQTVYSYDDLGRLWCTTDATGVKRYTLYDVSGRKSADIAANGQLTEYLYDAAGRLIQSIAYGTTLSQATLDGLTASSKVSGMVNGIAIRPGIAAGQDRITTYYHDAAGRLTGVQDADGYLTTTQYDGTGAITLQKTFANATSVTRLDVTVGTTRTTAPKQTDLVLSPDATQDRVIRNLYDASGRLAAQIDGENALTVWTYDQAGNKLSQLRRSAVLTSTEQAYTLAQLRTLTPLAGDEYTQWLYDGQGRQIAQLSAEGHLTEYTYDAAGRLKDTLQYLKQAFKPVITSTSPYSLKPFTRADLTDALRTTLSTPTPPLKASRTYNNRGLLETETAVDNTVTRYQYDDLQRLTHTTRAEGTTEARVHTLGYDDWGRINDARLQGEATGVTTTYDVAGRRASTTDARGHKTVYYYDQQGRQRYAILLDPTQGGEVRETIYSSFSEVSATVTHALRLSLVDANGLTGGQADATLDAKVLALSDASADHRTDQTYNRRGLIQQAVDALGHKVDYSYNAFGQLSREVRDIDPAGTTDARSLTVDHGYNRRGQMTSIQRSGSGLASVLTRSTFDALGRLDKSVNELDITTTYTYHRDSGSGRQVQIAGPAGSTYTTYDALDRVLAHKDRLGHTVTYTHDAVNRKLTVKTSEGFQTVTEYTRHGQTAKITDAAGATTTYAYDSHGNLLTVTDALGNVTKNSYDAGDNLIEVVKGLTAYEGGEPVNDGSATTTRYSFDAANRVLTQTVDPGGLDLITRYAYDGQGRRLQITDPRGTITTQVFNAKGELKEVVVDDVDGGLKLKTSYSYDAQSRVLSVTEGAGTGAARKTAYTYDVLGRRTSETVDPDGLKLKTRYEYDKAGRLLLKRNALEQVTARYRYDTADRLTHSVDALGVVTRYYYDNENRLTSTLAHAMPLAANWASLSEAELYTALTALGDHAANAANQLSVNAYDRDGRLVYSVDVLGQASERKYDAAGRVVLLRQYAQAISGVTAGMTTATIQGKIVASDTLDHVTRYAYDKVGNQRFAINAEGYVTENRYDAAGRAVTTVEHEQRWSGSLGIVSEVTLSGTYTPMRWEFNNAARGFTGAAGGIENGRLKLVSKPVAGGSWASVDGARSLPVGATLKLDIQPLQLQQNLHVILKDASGQPGRIGVILKPDGRLVAQRQTAGNTFPEADIGTYVPGTSYTIEMVSFGKGAWIYIYPTGGSRGQAGSVSYRAEELSLNWQAVRAQLSVHRAPSLAGETYSYVDNLEELPPTQSGRVTQYAYDAAGRPRFAVDAEGYVTETAYDDANARTTTRRYDKRISGNSAYTPTPYAPKLAHFTPEMLAGLGTSTRTSRELDRAGRLSVLTDGNGVQTQYGYDAAGRLTTEVRAANVAGQASTTRYKYNAAGLRSEVILGDGTAQASTTRYAYDTLGRLAKTIDPRGVALAEGAGDWEKAERMRLGHAADLSTLTPEARAAVQAELLARYTTETAYDTAGRVKSVTRRASSATDAPGTPQATLTTTTEYDAFGNAVKLTDARGYSRHQVFDKLGRVVQGIDAENYLTTYTYDAFGNLTLTLRLDAKVQGTVTAGQTVTVASTAPGSGAYVLADAALDQLTQRDYDRNNRLLSETDAEGYVEGTPGALNAFGERTSVRNKLGATTTYTYDRLGRVLTETLPVSVKVAGVDKPVVNAYEYDSRGNRIKHIEAQGLAEQRTTEMRYDAANRLTTRIGMAYAALSASDTLSTVTPADSYRYDARGNLVEHLSHGQLQANGSVTGGKRTVRYHDALDRQVLQLSADRVATRTSYDQAGHVVAQTTYATRLADAAAIDPATAPTITQDAANDRTYTHRYDELGRKVETLLDGLHAWDSGLTGTGLIISGLTPERTSLQKFFYDAAGNLTEVRNGRGYSSYSYYDGIGRKTLSLDAAGAAIAWDYERASGVATRETQYSGMLPGGYGRQADTLAGNGSINTPAQLLPVIQGLSSRVPADDRVTEYTLDELGRVTEKRILRVAQDHVDSTGTRTQALATATTKYSYNGLGQVTQLSELAAKLGSTDAWEVSDISYDALGRETRRQGVEFTDWEGSTVRPTTDVEYNGLGEVVRRVLRGKNPDAQVESDDRITRYAYDANGLLTQTTDASGAVTQYDYDAHGDLVRRTAKGVVRSDSTGEAPKLRDIVKRYTLDAAGRIASETTSESDKLAHAETRKTRYNAFGEIAARGIGDGFEEFFEYSTLGKISKTNAGDGAIKFYVYDAAGNQTREIKGNGDATYKVGGMDVAIDLRTLTLEQATSGKLKSTDSVLLPLYSRVSIYDQRNLVIQTIDPQIEVLKNAVAMEQLYQQQWVPAWRPPGTQGVGGGFYPSGSVVAVTPGTESAYNGASADNYRYHFGLNHQADLYRDGIVRGATANNIELPLVSAEIAPDSSNRLLFNTGNGLNSGATSFEFEFIDWSTGKSSLLAGGATGSYRYVDLPVLTADMAGLRGLIVRGLSGDGKLVSASRLHISYHQDGTVALPDVAGMAPPQTMTVTTAGAAWARNYYAGNGTFERADLVGSPAPFSEVRFRKLGSNGTWLSTTRTLTASAMASTGLGEYEFVLVGASGAARHGRFWYTDQGVSVNATSLQDFNIAAPEELRYTGVPAGATVTMRIAGQTLGAQQSGDTAVFTGQALRAAMSLNPWAVGMQHYTVSVTDTVTAGGETYQRTLRYFEGNVAYGPNFSSYEGASSSMAWHHVHPFDGVIAQAVRPAAMLNIPGLSAGATLKLTPAGGTTATYSTASSVGRMTVGSNRLEFDFYDLFPAPGAPARRVDYEYSDPVNGRKITGGFLLSQTSEGRQLATVEGREIGTGAAKLTFDLPPSNVWHIVYDKDPVTGQFRQSATVLRGNGGGASVDWDVSNLTRGKTYEFRYWAQSDFDGGNVYATRSGSVVVNDAGTPQVTIHPPTVGDVMGTRLVFSPPPGVSTFKTVTSLESPVNPGKQALTGYGTDLWLNYFLPASGSVILKITYEGLGTDYNGEARVELFANGTINVLNKSVDPTSQPVSFYVKGRQVHSARLHIAGQSVLLPGTYTAPSGSSAGYTSFVFDAKDLPQAAGVYDCDLQLLNEYGNQLYDETGKALWQHVQLRMDGGSALPQVYQQVTVLNTGTKVTIKRFQDFNAFGEVSEERDERVGERMLAAINDDLTARNQATQGTLTDTQKLAARTTLKYNVLGQLVAKLDPETFITLENGYRYRARPETRYGYDLLGRLTTLTDANGNLSRVQYLAGARGPDARVQREFDAAGGHADVLNVNGAGIRLNEYDVFGDSRRLTEAQGSDEQRTTERSYDKRGLLETVVRKGVQRLASGSAETLDTARDLSDTYTYDQLGQRLSATNALGIKTRTDYDALGRVVQTVSGNGFITSYSYALRVVGQADGITGVAGSSSGGHVLTTTRADGRTLKDKIDYFGHTTWHQDLAGTEFTYGFNSAAQLVRQTSTKRAGQSKGQDIAYSYYANGYIRSIEDRAQAILSQYAYDNAGNRVYEGIFLTATDSQGGLTLADGAKAFQSATIVYDELNRISRVRDDNFFDVRYEFDANGNRRRITSTYWDGVAGLLGGGTQDYWYAYDSLNRFTVSKGRLERTATGTDASGSRGTSDADTRYRVSRGTEGTLIGYDKLSQRRSATYTYVSGNTSQTINETYGYSQDGYLQTTKQGDKLVVTRKLDDIGRTTLLTDLVNGQSTGSVYDSDNRLLTQNANGQALFYLYYGNNTDTLQSATGAGELAYVGTSTENAGMVIGSGTSYQYAYWDDAKQSNINKVASINLAGSMSGAGASITSTLRYDVNGHIKSATDHGANITRTYTTNANGQVLRREGGNGTHDYYYADGHRIGDVGNTPDDKSRVSYAEQLALRGSTEGWLERRERYQKPRAVTSADFDQNYEPINDSYPGSAASSYTVRRNGESLRDIAQAIWGDSSMWYLIAEANGMLSDGSLAAGRVLVIPNKVTNIHNNNTTWRPYNAGEAIGAVDPNWDQDPRGPMEDFLLRQVQMNPDDPVSLEMWSVFKYGYQPDTSPGSGGQADHEDNPWPFGYSYIDATTGAYLGAVPALGSMDGGFMPTLKPDLAAKKFGVDWRNAPDESAAESARLERSGNRYAAWPDQTDAESARLARQGNPYADWPDQTGAETARLGRYENRAWFLESAAKVWAAEDAASAKAALAQQHRGADAYRRELAEARARERFNFGDGRDARDIRLSFGYQSRVSRELSDLGASSSFGYAGSSGSVGEIRAMSATEGFFTFNPMGRFLKGWGHSATEILKSPYTLTKEAVFMVGDAVGNGTYAAMNWAFGGNQSYQNDSALGRSLETYGVLGTVGLATKGAVLSLPGIAQIDAINRRDWSALGESGPGTLLAAAGLSYRPASTLYNYGDHLRPVLGNAEAKVLSRGEELRQRYGHLSGDERRAIIWEHTEEIARRQLEAMEASTFGAHFMLRHSPQVELYDQLVSAATGMRPDGKFMGGMNNRFTVDSTQFLSNKDMLYGINRAERIQQYAISAGNPINDYISFRFDSIVGEGFVKNTPLFGADLASFYKRTRFANFGIDSTTGRAVTAFPVISNRSLGILY